MGSLFVSRCRVLAILLLFSMVSLPVFAKDAKGIVFHDANGNGAFDKGEPGLPDVPVSNGQEVVLTNEKGRFSLSVSRDCNIFVIKPSGWQFHLNEGTRTAKSYYTHKPDGAPELKVPGLEPTGPLPRDLQFGLVEHDESGAFEMLAFGDTQPRDQQEIDYISHDVVEELLDTDAELGVVLGDIVFENLADLSSLAHSVGNIPVPWYYVIGNHDLNFDVTDRKYTDEAYERVFGPANYAFNFGKVHFIVFNNVAWDVSKREYHAEIGQEQMAFIENDLKHVPKDRLIVFMMHIPLMDVVDKDKLFDLLKDYPHTFSMSAHWHRQSHFFLDQTHGWAQPNPHHHLVQGTVCGGWWTGGYDELGIPHATMSDGVPNGYSFVTFKDNEYSVRYKVSRRPADYQMNIHTPELLKQADLAATPVIVNVFSGSARDTVRMRVDGGDWQGLAQFSGEDPYVAQGKAREGALATLIAKGEGVANPDEEAQKKIINQNRAVTGRSLPGPRETDHLWKAMLPAGLNAGYHVVEVEWTDQFGQVSTDKRIFRVE
ncbi:MAG: calcineurin-like phosphoesterase C-terminal domain-containing protein [Candidatus Hydrogenedentes bacterium]|nr:calcineurin-like phosphoesterase C-terminal domain-containing protein [Candidatus Hydrogenedentota bacterium]